MTRQRFVHCRLIWLKLLTTYCHLLGLQTFDYSIPGWTTDGQKAPIEALEAQSSGRRGGEVWGGAYENLRLDGLLRRLYKCGFTVRLFTTEQLLFEADNVLFRKVLIDGHCLHHFLPPVKTLSIQLRPASHHCQLPICKYMLYKRSFLVRCLFNCH